MHEVLVQLSSRRAGQATPTGTTAITVIVRGVYQVQPPTTSLTGSVQASLLGEKALT